ncbi:MAG TPA: hypothetical protein VFX33_04550 [Actinomycetales bacterium]|nr:hypothetical protein [Actinomycetales bacterium]
MSSPPLSHLCGILGHVIAALLVASAAVALRGWWAQPQRRGPSWWLMPAAAVLLVSLAAFGALLPSGPSWWDAPAAATAAAGMLASVAVGGPLTVAVLRSVSGRTDLNQPGRHEAQADQVDDIVSAGEVLRGGAWIGALERTAITATLLAGWPEGLAVVLAVKGLGRYPELRQPGAAERFIIGTFTSVLWAAACAGVVALTRTVN